MQVAFIWLVRWVSCATRSNCAGSTGAIRTSSWSDARKSSRLGGNARDARAVEGPDVRQEIGDLCGARGQEQGQGLRNPGLHLPHLLGIVVHQDEGIEAEIQLFG